LRASSSEREAALLTHVAKGAEIDLASGTNIIELYGDATRTAFGFFWKSGWAFVLGYTVSAMIQAFVPKSRLTRYMGKADFKGLSLSTIFGAISSSCSFAALATARSLVLKGAHFVTAVAFMFASTNLVIELGVLIMIFLGWQFLLAEVIGGFMLIAISSALIESCLCRRSGNPRQALLAACQTWPRHEARHGRRWPCQEGRRVLGACRARGRGGCLGGRRVIASCPRW